ncbi:hypothetical protein ACFQS7_25710 [Dankookia sp. GCM10030260]|uniref:hypothetical protein n=1 Tax=Dankookia sp. GCM10030260 TaxID=3273390 RepID=UPI0036234AEC
MLEAQGGQWRVVSLPAEAEAEDSLGRAPGEMLWSDDGYGYAASLARMKAEASTRSWSALYQQRPVPDTGHYFQRQWLREADRPAGPGDAAGLWWLRLRRHRRGRDFAVHVVVGMDPEGRQ